MKLSRASSYALHAVAFLAERKQTRPLPSHTIARARGIPERFLLKALKPLVSARVLQSVKGPNGGYCLARPATQISLLDVVEAVDGAIRGQVPFANGDGHTSNRGIDRHLEAVCIQAAEHTRQQLHKVSMAQLTTKPAKRK
jgi:Rrf2 family protein